MKLRRLYLHGFKSFADRTELRIHDGITAIVGPNGCGKSNISDAIRWALGEQRASAIRGSRMEEAIFQGTTERRAVNRAEVALIFSNEDRSFALPYDEIEVRRTVFREGGSEYELNRSAVRLRDILDLCRDTGLGTNAYAIIEQGMVDAILSDRPEERRRLFEEAAGIGKYKDRRRNAQRRLEAAEADLARLEDLIGEVDSKVRNLARQRRRAQRYAELRARRLALEVAAATAELEAARADVASNAARLAELAQEEPALRARLSAVELELERRRVEAGEAVRARAAVALRLEQAVGRIAQRERELAVAGERRTHAARRLEQIEGERQELRRRIASLEEELARIRAEEERQTQAVAALAAKVEAVQERQQVMRGEAVRAREAEAQARSRETELARRLLQLEAEATASERAAAEAGERLQALDAEEAQLAEELSRLDEQGDLFAELARSLAAQHARLEEDRAAAEQELAELRAAEAEARRALAAAEDRVNLLSARAAALETLEREYQGFAPGVAAALAARRDIDGLVGAVAELIRLPAERGAALEGALGPLLQVLVVRDAVAAERLRAWIARKCSADGTLALLPEPEIGRLEALLEVLEFAGKPAAEPVLLGRRERLAALREEVSRAAAEREACVKAREDLAERLAVAESRVREILEAASAIDLDLRRADADEASRLDRRTRAEQAHAELARRRADLESTIETASRQAAAAREQCRAVDLELTALHAGSDTLAADRAEREAEWEAVREEEAQLRVAHARAESTLAELRRGIVAADQAREQAADRLAGLDTEEAELRASLTALDAVHSEAGVDLEDLFRERDAVSAELRTLDEHATRAGEEAERLESEARVLRRSLEERSEERHRIEIAQTEAEAAVRAVQQRLEAEWGRPFEQLVREAGPVDVPAENVRAELAAVTADIERLGPINMLAIEEHEEESRRLDFLVAQRDDLIRARDDLQNAIRQINRTARQLFTRTFEEIRKNFARTFETLFEGGECEIWLEDEEDPLESGIEIMASPKGKRTQRIHLLSGGERALTALALLFAIYLVKPSPFCVLDEVDAPLDEANVMRFVAMLQEFKRDTQFIVITHNPRTMEAADWIYGVTMEEPGVSSIVGVRLDEVLVGNGRRD